MPAKRNLRPVIVCGLPRSGTSLVRELLNSHRRVLILDESPLTSLPSLKDLSRELEAFLTSPYETWRRLDELPTQSRLAWLLASVWAIGSRPQVFSRFLTANWHRYGVKTPSAELSWQVLSEILGPHAPDFVYCLRDPIGIYESLLSVPWGKDSPPEKMVAMMTASWQALRSIGTARPEALFVFDLRQTAGGFPARWNLVKKLFAFIGLKPGVSVLRFCGQWPSVNRRQPGWQLLGPTETKVRLARLFEMLKDQDAAMLRFFQTGKVHGAAS